MKPPIESPKLLACYITGADEYVPIENEEAGASLIEFAKARGGKVNICEWPGTAEEHAELLARDRAEVASPNFDLVASKPA